MKNVLIVAVLAIMMLNAKQGMAQGIAVNATGSRADTSALLDIGGTSKGMLIPRMTIAQRNAIVTPATGLMVYQTDGTAGFYYNRGTTTSPVWTPVGNIPTGTATGDMCYWNGNAWIRVAAGSNGQNLTLSGGVPMWVSPSLYSIIAASGANGTVSPPGVTLLPPAASQVYNITPGAGYHVTGVTVDGSSAGTVTSYTFSALSASHTISAAFAINTYTLTATAGINGTITPSGTTTVSYGGSQVYNITPSYGSFVSDVTVDGTSVGAVTSYTFSSVSANHTISASFTTAIIGMSFGGGILAYILQPGDPGYSSTVFHGLIAATSDQSTSIQWTTGPYTTTGASGTAIGTGSANTTLIIASLGTSSSYAAYLCSLYTGGGYHDWYLPSKDELNKLFINQTAIGGFANGYYWSSSEAYPGAWYELFGSGGGALGNSCKCLALYVRAVRSF